MLEVHEIGQSQGDVEKGWALIELLFLHLKKSLDPENSVCFKLKNLDCQPQVCSYKLYLG